MHLRVLNSYEDFDDIEELQTRIWEFEPHSVTPRHIFIAGVRSGGLVLGAFDHRDHLVGFSLGFRGERDNAPCLYSHLTGVLPELQGQGVGYALKMAQREHALRVGLGAIVWTFDPLMMPNARLNLQKLGGVVYRYIPNAYGSSAFKMYGDGFPTHRFELHWSMTEEDLPRNEPGAGWIETAGALPELLTLCDDGTPVVDTSALDAVLSGRGGILRVPEDHLKMRRSNPRLARAWQETFFHCAESCLSQGHHFVKAFCGTDRGGAYWISPT